jgi:hypothetical protein
MVHREHEHRFISVWRTTWPSHQHYRVGPV